MKLLLVGCDYSGKTTLAAKIVAWMRENLSARYADDVQVGAHDHFWFPNPELPPEDRERFKQLGPKAREQYQRYMISYHLQPFFWSLDYDLVLVGFHFSEAVYAPLYYGYGEEGAYAARSTLAREIEAQIMTMHPETVLVMLRASPEVIRRRMAERPNDESPQKVEDVERIVEEFDRHYANSLIRRRFVIDTSGLPSPSSSSTVVTAESDTVKTTTTADDTFTQWLNRMTQSYLEPIDLTRMLARRTTRS